MANNSEGNNAGAKRRRPSNDDQDPAPVPTCKLDSTIEAILRKKVRERLDIEKSHSSLLARIKLLEKHASDSTIPSGLRIQRVKAKGQNIDLLQPKFDDIIKDAELKLLNVAIEDLRSDVKACEEVIQQRENDIDGTIAQWKSHLQKLKELTPDQMKDLVDAAAAFVTELSSDSAVSRASKALQAEITNKESRRESMDSNEQFMPTESTIREIIRQEICHAQESNANSTSNRQ